jgi:hypothetical protein
MGMSTHVIGYKPADETWKKMKAVWDSCRVAGVPVPDTVSSYFNGEYPGDTPGMEISIQHAVKELSVDATDIIEVDISKLPAGVSHIRFCNSW